MLLLTENLAPLPSERFIIMKAYYTPDCPIDYTPKYFTDQDPQTESDLDSDDVIEIGDIETQFHKFSMRYETEGSIFFEITKKGYKSRLFRRAD